VNLRRSPLALALAALVCSCSQKKSPAIERLAILRFDNLTGEAAFDWTGRAIAQQLVAQLTASGKFEPFAADGAGSAGQRDLMHATGIRRLLYGHLDRTGDRLRLRAELEDTSAGRFVAAAEAAGPARDGIIPLADVVARQLGATRPPPTRYSAALAAYIDGLEARGAEQSAQAFERAVVADPGFGAPYLALVQLALARQDRAAAEKTLERARAQNLSEIDRARLEVESSRLAADPEARRRALTALARLTPSDPLLLRSLGELDLAAKRYTSAAACYERARSVEPDNVSLLNTLGYVHAYAGNLAAAVETLREYERLRPGDANPLDSLGEVHLYLGRFQEAENLFRQAYQKDPSFFAGTALVKAAQARLFTGDLAGADRIFTEYLEARRQAGDPGVDYHLAEWEFLTGRHAQAIARMEKFAAAAAREPASHAQSQLAIWKLLMGDRARAAVHARLARIAAATPASAAMAGLCAFLAQREASAAEWAARAGTQRIALIYALLLGGHFTSAEPLLKQWYEQSPTQPSDPLPVLWAWTLIETKQAGRAAALLDRTPVFHLFTPSPFTALWFPRILRLRAVVAELKGARDDAERNERLYRQLSGRR